jgi:hypothetical protein
MNLPKLNLTKKKAVVIITASLLILISLPLTVVLAGKDKQKSKSINPNLLSPLNEKQAKEQEIPRYKQASQKEEKIYNLDYYLHLAKSFLAKATRLANDNSSQTEIDKAKIINTINQALDAANKAVKYYPKSAEPYLLRAQIWQKVEHLMPEAKENKEKDLKTASQILGKPDPDIPQENQAQPLDFIPVQKAQEQSNIIIAEPNQEKVKEDTQTKTGINANKGEATIKASQTQIKITTNKLTEKSLIYTKPQTQTENQTLYIKSRNNKEGWFIISIQKPIEKDITFTWWLIDQE